ncbi:hypothetical protein B0H15DRAFT_783012 [Mycena belliarum]|uniref:Uncharacterized protein n=1 Tax=Mycena belliarum TaxID=1033014 RepID=A0AAD6U378_9AGAR|nr:hypothetical protein B0H15DRAFT_783012 [Mycena belliae]
MDVDDEESANSTTPTLSTRLFEDDPDDDEQDEDFYPDLKFELFSAHLEAIRECISNVALPSSVGRPPGNLGEATHGKLKAQEYLTLFSVVLPLIIPELWWDGNETEKQLLMNFYHLVACTNIISSFSASNTEADQFMAHYIQYRTDLPQLFEGFQSKPNNHFAMHDGPLMKFWGPLPAISEFPGERLNGIFGKTKNNRRIYDMPTTMCTQVARRGRLEAILSEDQFADRDTSGLAPILNPVSNSKAPQQLDSSETATILARAKELPVADYQMLLQYLRSTGQLWRDYEEIPHPDGALILPPRAIQPPEFTFDGDVFSCKHSNPGNSGIQFTRPVDSAVVTGFIETIWQIPLQGHIQTFILVDVHNIPPPEIRSQLPFESMPRLNTAVVEARPSGHICIIEPRHIITHLAVYKRPVGTFGIDRDILTVCWSLNRGRRG